MLIRSVAVCAAAFVAAVTIARPIQALTMQECSVKYKAAQAAGTLKGTKWNDFRKAECGPDASSATPTTAPTRTAPAAAPTSRTTAAPPEDGTSGRRGSSVPHRGVTEILRRDFRQVRRACTPALINTMPTRRIMPTAGSSGSKKAAAITASATGTLRAEVKQPGGDGVHRGVDV